MRQSLIERAIEAIAVARRLRLTGAAPGHNVRRNATDCLAWYEELARSPTPCWDLWGSGESGELRAVQRGVDQPLRKLEVLAEARRPETLLQGSGSPGLIFSFVPAHGESRVGAVQEQLNRTWTAGLGLTVLPADFNCSSVRSLRTVILNLAEDVRHAHGVRRLDGKTWGAFLRPENGREILDASQSAPRETRRLMDFARRRYDIVSVDLTGAREAHAIEAIKESTSVFFVSSSDDASVSMVCDKVAWMRSLGLERSASLLLHRVPGGLRTDAIEDLAGIPVCSLIDNDALVSRLAVWLGAEREFRLAAAS